MPHGFGPKKQPQKQHHRQNRKNKPNYARRGGQGKSGAKRAPDFASLVQKLQVRKDQSYACWQLGMHVKNKAHHQAMRDAGLIGVLARFLEQSLLPTQERQTEQVTVWQPPKVTRLRRRGGSANSGVRHTLSKSQAGGTATEQASVTNKGSWKTITRPICILDIGQTILLLGPLIRNPENHAAIRESNMIPALFRWYMPNGSLNQDKAPYLTPGLSNNTDLSSGLIILAQNPQNHPLMMRATERLAYFMIQKHDVFGYHGVDMGGFSTKELTHKHKLFNTLTILNEFAKNPMYLEILLSIEAQKNPGRHITTYRGEVFKHLGFIESAAKFLLATDKYSAGIDVTKELVSAILSRRDSSSSVHSHSKATITSNAKPSNEVAVGKAVVKSTSGEDLSATTSLASADSATASMNPTS